MSAELETLKKNSSFCSMAWDHQFMDPTGRVKPCCRFDESHRPEENSLNHNSLSHLFYGPWMTQIREKMLKGDSVDGCRRCYEEEASGKKSLRQRYNDSSMLPIHELVTIEKPNIRWLELAISNACNLACRMCDSRYSLKWYDEELAHWGTTKSKTKISKFDITNIDPFIADLVHLKFTGGEPLITPEHWRIIDQLIEKADCKNIYLNYSTNCTIYPKKEWVEKWKHFKSVEFAMSFDSADPQESEYIRWPADYGTTETTTKAFIELSQDKRFQPLLRTTVSLLNIYHLPETILWWLNHMGSETTPINPTHLTYPQILSVRVLPSHLKKKVEAKFKTFLNGQYPKNMQSSLTHMLNHMNSEDQSHMLPELLSYIQKTDQYRKQDFFSSYPHFSSIFDGVMNHDANYPETKPTYTSEI